jgi:hypothetical protein
VKGFHLSVWRWEFELLNLGHRINFDSLAATNDARTLYIFVNQTLYGKDYLIIERRLWLLGQTADAYVQLVQSPETRRAVRDQNRNHARRESAVRNDVDAGRTRIFIERQFGSDDRVVAAEVAEMDARLYGRPRELQIMEVCDATDASVVAAHQLYHLLPVCNINLCGRQFIAADG